MILDCGSAKFPWWSKDLNLCFSKAPSSVQFAGTLHRLTCSILLLHSSFLPQLTLSQPASRRFVSPPFTYLHFTTPCQFVGGPSLYRTCFASPCLPSRVLLLAAPHFDWPQLTWPSVPFLCITLLFVVLHRLPSLPIALYHMTTPLLRMAWFFLTSLSSSLLRLIYSPFL